MHSEQPAGSDITAVVISGGTAANEILNAFELFSRLDFVLPVSDNGGSSAEMSAQPGRAACDQLNLAFAASACWVDQVSASESSRTAERRMSKCHSQHPI